VQQTDKDSSSEPKYQEPREPLCCYVIADKEEKEQQTERYMRGRSPYAIRQYEKTNGVERKENVVANLQDELSNLKATVGVDGETAADAGDSGDTDAATAPNAEHNTADEAEKVVAPTDAALKEDVPE